ncbi:tail fiber domain-containing protein [Stenotrophomonas indicatrix]|uniref:Tail fiber domain-containing protein n=1 Tax=Stenotrophomonas indicatrix TaxID=2045451 RepID=A0ABT8QE95_9GAMM|nr:tail fiber domain-containing protein [Stenotrophomonas indicatrix]MDN8661598.1 tail fiber domain-containing protein [Stenotrophomonas indicatrix]MDN8668970.1 tail fiber domain-containing protein [Stenotrophomonas indicatrix]
MRLKITDAGFAKLVNPPNTGTNAVLITQIGLTSTAFAPSGDLTALPGEIKRVATFGGQAVGDDTLHVTIRDDSATAYSLRGFGLYLADGTLFATYGQTDPIMEKSAASMLLLATDARFTDVDITQIQFGNAEFIYPPATTEVLGVVELATNTEAEDAADTQRAVTPRGLRAFTDKRFGAAAPTALARTLLSAATTAAARTALELKGAALKDTGHGNGLDADTLDGKHASAFALAGDFATVGHKHVIADVTGLQGVLDAKAVKGTNSFTDQQFVGGSAPLVGFGSAGAEQSFIGGWANSGIWRVYNTDRTANGELTIKHGDTPRWNGSAMWHAGNFAPDTKVDKTGGTFTGHVAVNGNSLRSYGWGGVANDGVLVLGDASSYLFKNGPNFTFANSAGGYTTTLNAGGSIWTSGNFDPAAKVSKGGDVMSGSLTTTELWLKNGSNANGWIGTGPDVVYMDARLNNSQNPDAHMRMRADAFTWANKTGSICAAMNGSGEFRPTSLHIPHNADGTRIAWNQNGGENGYGCSEYYNFKGGGTGGHVFYSSAGTNHRRTMRLRDDAFLELPGGLILQGIDNQIRYEWPGTETIRLVVNQSSGNIGWWQEGLNQWLFQINKTWGNTTIKGSCTAGGGFDVGSSRKLKAIDGSVPYGLAAVEHMELATGHYKPEYNSDGRRRLFFVAEQLAELVPEAVDLEGIEFNGERVATVKLDQLLPVMAKAIQELAAEVRALKAER